MGKGEKLINRILLQQCLETKWQEGYSITYEMFTHCLDPVQPERMQHSTRPFHDAENSDRQDEPHVECHDSHDYSSSVGSAGEGIAESHVP